jgi:hypothetical protein
MMSVKPFGMLDDAMGVGCSRSGDLVIERPEGGGRGRQYFENLRSRNRHFGVDDVSS